MPTSARFTHSLAVLFIVAGALAAPRDARSQTPPSVPMDVTLFRDIARRQNQVVVAIKTAARVEHPVVEDAEWFERFFGRKPQPRTTVRREIGSGFLISRDGEILTNDHVVADAFLIEVTLAGTKTATYRAKLIGRDPISDSALIKLQDAPDDLPVAILGDSDALEAGDWVMAIGNPFQLGHSVTVGVISYQGRPFELDGSRWQKLIQTDAAVNPGNSGGPLLNVRGEVVGINVAMLADAAGASTGIGFAVPINSVKSLLTQLRAGRVVRGHIGLQLRPDSITDHDARALGLPRTSGALIRSVELGSTAARAGLRAGDLVIDFAGTPVANADDLIARVSSTPPRSRARITFIRDGRTRTLDVEVLTLETPVRDEARVEEPPDFGLVLADVTQSPLTRIPLSVGIDGSLVQAVQDESPAARAGVEEGDILRKVNQRTVHTAAEATEELRSILSGRPAFVVLWRDGHEILVAMQRD
jgi:serine protease Do